MINLIGVIAASVFRVFTDNFNRTTAGSLGSPSGGIGAWIATTGTWYCNGTQAQSDTANSSYPIAAVDMSIYNPTILLDVSTSNGAGATFWVSDASNWFAVYPWQATVTTYASICSAYSQICNAYFRKCNSYGQLFNKRYGAFYGCSGYGSACSTYSQVCTTYTQQTNYAAGTRYLRLAKNVAGSVSTIVDEAVSAAIASIKVIVNSAGQITATAYSSVGQSNQTGSSIINTPTSPTKATKHGIILAPGGWTSGKTVDNITIERSS